MQQKLFRPKKCGRKVELHTLAIVTLLALVQPFSVGQAGTKDEETTRTEQPSENTASPSGANAALLKELESMRARIEELEQQLRSQGGTPAPGNETTSGAEQIATAEAAALNSASSRFVEKPASIQKVVPCPTSSPLRRPLLKRARQSLSPLATLHG